MALNWAMVNDDGSRPVPLPGEKILYSIQKCNISLNFENQNRKWISDGSAFVTSQRVIFLRQPPLPAPANPSAPSEHLRSLSVPINQFVDSRYMIPIFSAPYYEASIVPSLNGGLPSRESDQPSNIGLLKIWFNEGGGMAFRDAVEEIKSRREEGTNAVEALPLYAPNTSSTIADASNSVQAPSNDDMEAAEVAREEEEAERDEQRNQSNQTTHEPELPPAYQE